MLSNVVSALLKEHEEEGNCSGACITQSHAPNSKCCVHVSWRCLWKFKMWLKVPLCKIRSWEGMEEFTIMWEYNTVALHMHSTCFVLLRRIKMFLLALPLVCISSICVVQYLSLVRWLNRCLLPLHPVSSESAP